MFPRLAFASLALLASTSTASLARGAVPTGGPTPEGMALLVILPVLWALTVYVIPWRAWFVIAPVVLTLIGWLIVGPMALLFALPFYIWCAKSLIA